MFGAKTAKIASLKKQNSELMNIMNAIDGSFATIEFDLFGNILTANSNFLKTVGYSLNEIQGKHHSIFVDPEYKKSNDYINFWKKLAQGEVFSGRFLRINKAKEEVWIEATYASIKDKSGSPYKVVKLATNISAQVHKELESKAKLRSIDKSYAVIEFETDGKIISANKNFCDALGYTEDEIIGKHHHIFVDKKYANSNEYKNFWLELSESQDHVGVFSRTTKEGKEIWIQAAYIPVKKPGKKPHKVIKIASDITQQKMHEIHLSLMVEEAGEVLQDVSKGDLTNDVKGEYKNELHKLKTHLNNSIQTLSSAMNEIKTSVKSVSESEKEVTALSQSLSQRTEKSTQSIQHTNSVMTKTQEQVKTTQIKVDEARRSTVEQQNLIDTGTQLMSQSLTAMEQIKGSSEEITNIVSLIDGIAFQTNLLALNAAVEAARAGEHGRGFAVVAGEVRNLAQKSADAAKDIKTLISQAVEQSQTGVEVVEKLSENLNSIRKKSTEVNDVIESVGELAKAQSDSINRISDEVSNIDNATQENVGFVEKVSLTADDLTKKSQAVINIVEKFKIH